MEDLALARDQNRYLEEHNTHLTSNLQETKQRMLELQATNRQLQEELTTTKKLLKDIQTENDLYRTENTRLSAEYDRRIQVCASHVTEL